MRIKEDVALLFALKSLHGVSVSRDGSKYFLRGRKRLVPEPCLDSPHINPGAKPARGRRIAEAVEVPFLGI